MTTATLPNRLVGVIHGDEHLRMAQLETSRDISRAIGFTREPRQLAQQIADLIRSSYGFDAAYILRWLEDSQALVYEHTDAPDALPPLPIEHSGVLRQALLANEVIFIPNTQRSLRFAPDPAWPQTRTRAIAPIRVGDQIYGLLDLHGASASRHLGREKLVGLQSLADQLGVAIHNAKLFQEALDLRRKAEKANQIKTQLLANITHELGDPLAAIAERSRASLDQAEKAAETPATSYERIFRAIYDDAAYLLRLIDELLELSQTEIDDLTLAPQLVDPLRLLTRVFGRSTSERARSPAVEWRLQGPERLPLISVDGQRMEQIVANLLENACTRTQQGVITLGAKIAPPHLHIWVSDSGDPIPSDEEDHLFTPLTMDNAAPVSASRTLPSRLGLAIARRLALLHQGSLTVESQPGQEATFHLLLPLPSLSDQAAHIMGRSNVALLFSMEEMAASDIAVFFQQAGLSWQRATSPLEPGQKSEPSLIVWDNARGSMEDWAAVVTMRNDSRLRQLPFLLFLRRRVPTASHAAKLLLKR